MNKGDKVRIKDNWVGPGSSFDGLEGEVVHGDSYVGHVYIKPLSDRPDGYKREEFYWPESQLELISEEKSFEVGDRVKILGTTTAFLKETIGRLGTVIAAEGNFSLRVDVDDYTHGESGSEWYYDPSSVELVTEEEQTIEVGDTVKATHAESGSVVQGVASYVDLNNDDLPTNVEIEVNQNSIGTLDLYVYQGWEFELIAKKEVPKPTPKVGDVVGDAASLPIGAVTRTPDFSGTYLHTVDGWRGRSGNLFTYPDILDDTIIVYLPPTDSK